MKDTEGYKIKLLRSRHLENEYYCFDFQKPENFHFTEGQYGIFEMPEKHIEGRPFRAFSLESTDNEPFIRIATRIVNEPSEFKKELLHLHEGDEIKMAAPKGKFTLVPEKTAVFIAGGIGITPIRSMLFSEARNKQERNDLLIYSELEKCYPFKDEIEHLRGLEIQYAADIEPTQRLIRDAAKKYQNEVVYYLSGSPGFVNGITGLLKENGIQEENIRHDVFVGY